MSMRTATRLPAGRVVILPRNLSGGVMTDKRPKPYLRFCRDCGTMYWAASGSPSKWYSLCMSCLAWEL
jgi:hypothetical protein